MTYKIMARLPDECRAKIRAYRDACNLHYPNESITIEEAAVELLLYGIEKREKEGCIITKKKGKK